MKGRCLLIALVVALAAADDKPAEPSRTTCSSPDTWLGKLTALDIADCTPSKPCLLHRGTEKGIGIKFTALENITGLEARVHGIIGGMAVPYAVPQRNACENSGVVCPLQAGQTADYSALLPIKSYYPMMSLKVMWELINNEKQVVVCVMFPVKITNAVAASK